MKIILEKELTYKNASGEEATTNCVFLKEPTIGDLIQRQNRGIFASLINKVQKYSLLGLKSLQETANSLNIEQEKIQEQGQEKEKVQSDEDIIAQSEALIISCINGGYNEIIEDILDKGPAYFDRFIFVDNDMTKNICGDNLVKTQLTNTGDIFIIYKVMLNFFFQVSVTSTKKKIEK